MLAVGGSSSSASAAAPMPPKGGSIHCLEINNFKSWAGRRIIGPMKKFTSVIGPNGSGKSNVMDAVSFATGLTSRDLRGKQLKDLIYRATTDKGNEDRSASVTLVYENGGKKIAFKRSISSTGVGEYRIDARVVKADVYFARLKALGINTKAHLGFLVFQGYVADLAAKTPMELTALFETISGSEELKEEYERLERAKKKAEEDQVYSYQRKKGLAQERTSMKRQKEEAEKYTELLDERKGLQRQLYLTKLFGVEREVAALLSQVAEAKGAADAEAATHAETEEAVKQNEKEKARLARKVVELERKAVSLQQEVEGKTPEAIRLKEEIAHAERRKKMAEKSLQKVKEQERQGAEKLESLEADAAKVKREISELEKAAADEASGSNTGELSLGAKQQKEYDALKVQAGAATAALRERINKKRSELQGLVPTLMTLRTRVEELGRERESIEGKVKALDERRAASAEKAKELGAAVKALQQQHSSLTKTNKAEREKRHAAEEREREVEGLLRSSKAERRESEREKRSAEALDNLQRLFPGVHGRMTDICKISQKKYHKAVTSAMGKSFEAIVVDTEKTAIDCIKYLKEKKSSLETFLPLDTIRGKPVREAHRHLGGSKLPVLDVIACQEQFLPALQYAVGDAIVCDTLDEARQLAFQRPSGDGERFKVVTVDGFMISKAGLMSGLGHDDKNRAGKWNQKEHEALKVEQESLRKTLEELGTPGAAQEKETSLGHTLAEKQHELKQAQDDLNATKTRLDEQREELDAVYNGYQQAEAALKQCEAKVAKSEEEASGMQAEADAEEDKVFAKFSKSLGIASVREYEETTNRANKEREAAMLTLKGRLAKLEPLIAYEKRKELPEAVRKLEAAIADDEKLIAKKGEKMAKAQTASDGIKAQAAEAENQAKESREAQEASTNDLKALKKELRACAERLGAAKIKVTQIENAIDQQRATRQRMFAKARVEQVELPLVAAGATKVADAAAAVARAAAAAAGSAAGDGAADGGAGGGGAGNKGKRKRSSAAAAAAAAGGVSSAGSAFWAAELMASESFSATGLIGTATMEGGDEGDGDAMDVDDATGGSSSGTFGGTSGGGAGTGGTGDDASGPALDEFVRVDFSSLGDDERSQDASEYGEELQRQIGEMVKSIEGMAPNMKAIVQFDEVQDRLQSIESEFEGNRTTARSIAQQFAAVQAKRTQLFMAAFRKISAEIDDIYKDLTQVEGVPLGGTVYLSLEGSTEPYLEGIQYTAMPAGKRFRQMDQLSGGEKTVAALALLFAVWTYKPSPFFVMDEIDAALDNVNVTRVAQYIRQRADEGDLQFVVISLKDNFYFNAHGLVGIYRDRRLEASSCVTIDLENLEQQAEDGAAEEEDEEAT